MCVGPVKDVITSRPLITSVADSAVKDAVKNSKAFWGSGPRIAKPDTLTFSIPGSRGIGVDDLKNGLLKAESPAPSRPAPSGPPQVGPFPPWHPGYMGPGKPSTPAPSVPPLVGGPIAPPIRRNNPIVPPRFVPRDTRF